MPFTPPSSSFNYLPFSGVIPNEPVVLDLSDDFYLGRVTVYGDWLNVITGEKVFNEDTERWEQHFVVSIKPQVANNLPEGYHEADFAVEVFTGPLPAVFTYHVILRILPYTALTISPSLFYYNHVQGDPNPAARYCQISTSSSWSITPDQNWLTFSATNGSGNSTVALFVDTGTLPLGQSLAQFLVDDGRTQKWGQVYVSVTGTGTNDYVVLSPTSLEFSETYGQAPTDVRQFTIDSTLAVTIAADVAWLNFSATTAPIGYTTIDVNTINTEGLAVGAYPATITVSSTIGDFFIDVLLIISEKQFPNIKDNGFYFAEDRNRLALTSSLANLEAIISIKATGGSFGVKNYERKIPYFRNVMSVIMGLETEILLKPTTLPPLATIFYKHIDPIRYDVRVSNRPIGNPLINYHPKFYSNLQFINGTTPEGSDDGPGESFYRNILTYQPDKFTVPADGYLAFTVRSENNINSCVVTKIRSGQIPVPVTHNFTVPSTHIYSAILKMEEYNLQAGDVCLVQFGFYQFQVQIKPSQNPTTQIIWENEWDCPEIFNATGMVEINVNDDTDTVVTSRDGKDYERVIETKVPKTFTIGTGNIYSVAEREHLATILKAKRIWVQIGANRTEVVHAIRNVDVFKTRDFTPEFDLKFKSAVV